MRHSSEATTAARSFVTEVHHDPQTDAFEWRGKNRSPNDPAAEWSKSLRFEF